MTAIALASPVARPTTAAAPAPAPAADVPGALPPGQEFDQDAGIVVDTELVPGLRLPKIPGLPDAGTRVPTLGELKDLLGPPTPGSAAAKADMAVVKGAQLLRSKAGDAWAQRMNDDGATKVWFDLARRYRKDAGTLQGWLGTALLASSMASNAIVTGIGKQVWKRPRPFVLDPSITPPLHKKPHANQSYPSGHASSAFAAARVISVLEPKLAVEAFALATQVATSRVYAGVHFPTDVVAGALLGMSVGDAALRTIGKR